MKNELCWAQYGPLVSDGTERLGSSKSNAIEQLLFESHALKMPFFYHHSQRLCEEELEKIWTRLFSIGRGNATTGEGVFYRHGHVVGNLDINVE